MDYRYLFGYQQKHIPKRPDDPFSLPEDHPLHWYDLEHAGWNVVKNPLPESPGDGPRGKQITLLLPGEHPYFHTYCSSFRAEAEAMGMDVRVHQAEWDAVLQNKQVERCLKHNPDLIVLVPCDVKESIRWYQRISSFGIPVIGSNLMPHEESFPSMIAWSGPDDWAQARSLADAFAKHMQHKGGYCILEHAPGSSVYFARCYGVITQLKEQAPRMRCLDRASTHFDPDLTESQVLKWHEEFGSGMTGIVSADDNITQLAVQHALVKLGRDDVVTAAFGSSAEGLQLLKSRSLAILSYQSPELDGSLPVQVAADWFSGLSVDPMIYLPVRILTAQRVEHFLKHRNMVRNIEPDAVKEMVIGGRIEPVADFFSQLRIAIEDSQQSESPDFTRGLIIEVFSILHGIIKMHNLPESEMIGNYADCFKLLFRQKSLLHTTEWLERVARDISDRLMRERGTVRPLGERVEEYLKKNYMQPVSLKTISHTFGVSAAHLGHIFKAQTGISFSEYLNRYRLERARYLLIHENISAKDAARKVGYQDPNYFYRVFKKYFSMYPSQLPEKQN